jgi:nitroimidazol reductase NimA-like FMN-containing flavoprotein (pyridoxamine 5'-phosphate oxidase superfamily)
MRQDADAVRAVVDANRYMTLATADESGHPWVSPVWFATLDYCEFFWVSKPEARHSRNVAVRPDVAIVVFDSHQVPGADGAHAVYLSARAQQVPDADLERALAVFTAVSERHALPVWTRDDVVPPARHRLYRAIAGEHFLLTATDERIPIDVAGA